MSDRQPYCKPGILTLQGYISATENTIKLYFMYVCFNELQRMVILRQDYNMMHMKVNYS